MKHLVAGLAALAFVVVWIIFVAGSAIAATDPSSLPWPYWQLPIVVATTLALLWGLWKVMEAWGDVS